MKINEAYNKWSATYDVVLNSTRDMEAVAFRKTLSEQNFLEVLELGCGTGKNTEWLSSRANHVTGIDFSEEMLIRAKEKNKERNVSFIHADISTEWKFAPSKVNLVTCSLVLEHIKDIDFVFKQAANHLEDGGLFYIGELHPFKQYQGSKARFETSSGIFELECFVHHISDYFQCAEDNGFRCMQLKEWFDDDNKSTTPRLITFLFRRG
jgi:ubiquinone/menaquinone biosynthesis C-methylase UbiE